MTNRKPTSSNPSNPPINPNDDMKLEVVDEDDTLGLRNAVRNADAGDENENVQSREQR